MYTVIVLLAIKKVISILKRVIYGYPLASSFFEKFFQQFAALIGHDAAVDCQGVVEAIVAADGVNGSCRTGFRVGGAVDKAADPCLDKCAHTHYAGF